MSEIIRVALYARVSLDETNKDDRRYQEPENQLEPLRQWARSQNWYIIEEYIDRASGADHNRPNFQRMMNDAMKFDFSVILVWKLDRFSREGISHTLAYLTKLKKRGIAVKSLSESWLDTSSDNPMSEVIIAIMSWAASEERRKISERTKAGIQRLRNIGQWKGGRPKKRVAPNPVEENKLP
jgi:DNA invertase Pin-like site-specific DNA recombinase